MNTKLTTLTKLALVAAIATTTSVGVAKAATFSESATISIVQALSLSQTTQMNLGVVQRPSSGTQTAIVSTAGTPSGTITYVDNAAVRAGAYSIAGSALNTISISAVDDANVAGLTFTALSGSYNGGSATNLLTGITGGVAPGAGKTLNVGGTLQVASTVVEGIYAPSFTLTVNYE